MIAVILIFYRQKDKHRTIMERKQTKQDYNIPSSIAGYYITQYGTETKDMESILR